MDVFSHFLDNIKHKTTNPFIGTLIGVWLVRNWELVYTLFNFDDGCLLADKKKFVWDYYQDKNIWIEFLTNFGYALAFLIIGYIFIIISRIILNVVYHRIIPFLNSKTVSSLVVDNTRFETVKNTRDEYFKKIGELEEERIQLEQKNTLLNTENIEIKQKQNIVDFDIKTLQHNNSVLSKNNNELSNANTNLNKKIDEYVNQIDALNNKLKDSEMINNRLLFSNINNSVKFHSNYMRKTKSNTGINIEFYREIVDVVENLTNQGALEDFYTKASQLYYRNFKDSKIRFESVEKYLLLGLMESTVDISSTGVKNYDKPPYRLSTKGEVVFLNRAVL